MKSLTSIDEILHNQSEIRETAAAFFDENVQVDNGENCYVVTIRRQP